LLLLAFTVITLPVISQNSLNIVPIPAKVKMGKGYTVIKQPVGFIVYDFDEADENDGKEAFKKHLRTRYKLTKFTDGDSHSYGLPFEIHYSRITEKQPAGYYELNVEPGKVYIKGTALGKFYAFETLKQLIQVSKKKEITIPVCKIKDYPRFSYRGMHLDVGRHFMTVDLVKKYIDYLAMYKFNTFHWHLTEDQGWRIEIKKYPKLTEIGGWRNGTIVGSYPGTGNDSIRYGGFYTQEQIKEVIKYAADRYITIIPEIEMPGHSSAAIAAYPQLSCFPDEDTKYPAECVWAGPTKGKQVQQTWGVFEDVFCPSEYTFDFLQDVLDEVMALFPSQYIHIGGDECPKDAWKRSAFCQQLMKEKGLKDEHELQSYFIQRIEKYINSKGKKIIGWDEILEGGLAPNATVMSWRGEKGGIAAAKQHHNVIMTPEYPLYINHSQTKKEDSVTQGGYNPLEAVYKYEPIPKELTAEEGKYVLGAQGNVWSEYISSRSKLEYTIFPRMAALAEVLWTPKEKRNWKDFERRLPVIFERLDKAKINYSKAYYDTK
ncbi:MAG: beta-N-acetylhexosaminidase, partial [Bacteroidota bacterium]